jgi:hypothetical protein
MAENWRLEQMDGKDLATGARLTDVAAVQHQRRVVTVLTDWWGLGGPFGWGRCELKVFVSPKSQRLTVSVSKLHKH